MSIRLGVAGIFALCCGVSSVVPARAQEAGPTSDVIVRNTGPGRPGRILRQVAASPHVTIRSADRDKLVIAKDTIIPVSVIAIGVHVAVEGRVEGDLVVVNGDLFMRPGGHVTGRAVSIGGGVYGSSLAKIDGETMAFLDVEFDMEAREGVLYLDHRTTGEYETPVVTLPMLYGLRIPTYTRVDGLAIPFGPRITLNDGRFLVDPMVTYRSDLGSWDPSLAATIGLGRRDRLELWAGRGTFTNDAWIISDILNSVTTLAAGSDRRNYFRAERAEARLTRLWQLYSSDYELSLGGRGEFAYSVRAGGPWSVWGRDDPEEGIPRPNPPVRRGRIYSALAGARGRWELAPETIGSFRVDVEHALRAPDDARFTQLTLDGALHFPTFGTHSFDIDGHAVATLGDSAPPQRVVYFGGQGTLPTFELLEFPGDQLLYIDARYNIPIDRLQLPFLGAPIVSLRYRIGSAGFENLPDLEQNIGVRAVLKFIKLEFVVDPATGNTKYVYGLAMTR